MYHSGTAFEIHGEILARYNALSTRVKDSLGYLISDQQPLANPDGFKSVFQEGAIYCSERTGAFEVTDEIYRGFESSGETEKWGFPIDEALPATNGILQKFEKGTWYFKIGSKNAFSVQGEILKAFVSTGGLDRWGYPISDETAVQAGLSTGKRDIRLSEFENCSFYWSSFTGAHAVQGEIRKKWRYLGGPDMHYIQELGLPTTEELDVPRTDKARMSGFEQGVIVWYGREDDTVVVYPFKIFLKSIKRQKNKVTEGCGIHFQVLLNKGEETIFCQRYPDGMGSRVANDVATGADRDLNLELPVILKPEPIVPFTLTVDVWEEGDHQVHLGKWTQILDATNAWGLAWNGYLTGSADKVEKIEAQVIPIIEYLYY